MDRLHREGARHELSSEPLQKIRMRRFGAPDSEVVLRLDETEAKKTLPPPVDGHAMHERILRMYEPAREVEPRLRFPRRQQNGSSLSESQALRLRLDRENCLAGTRGSLAGSCALA